MNDIFAVGKNDIALWATIFTLRVNGGGQAFPNERASFVYGSCGDNDIQACGLNDIFAFGKNDIALRATIFTLRVNGGVLRHFPMNAPLLFMAATGITIFKPAA